MSEVLILGDSFADPHWPDFLVQNIHSKHRVVEFAWPSRVAAQHNVTNFALQGTGPDYSLTRLREWITTVSVEQVANTHLIFVCSAPQRLDLSCYKQPNQQVHIYEHANGDIRHKSKMFAKQAMDWYFTPDWEHNRDLMYYSTATQLASQFKSVLYWPVQRTQTHNVRVTQPHNFTMPQKALVPLSARDDPNYNGGEDNRPNHFQERNHNIIFEQLNNWLKHGTALDVSNIR